MFLSTQLLKKINYIVGLLPIGALFGLIAWGATIEIKDLDLWLHLAMGKYILQHFSIPDHDILSCTIAGQPWINHEWLFQVLSYGIFSHWGPDGLLKMQMVVAASSMLLLLLLGYNKDQQLGTTFVLFIVYLVFQQRFTIRPEIFSLLFFTVYIYILSLHLDKKWTIPVLFFVQVLWTNMHGFFFFGPLFVLMGFISEFLKRRVRLPFEWNDVGRLTDEEYKRLQYLFMAVVLACLVNPYTFQGAWYPLKVFFSFSGENKIFFHHIEELQKPILWSTIFDRMQQPHYKLLILISFVSLIFNRRRIDISALLLWVVFLVFSLQAMRNLVFFAFAAYLVYVTNSSYLSWKDVVPLRFINERFQYLTSMVAKFLFFIWILLFAQGFSQIGYYDFQKYEKKSEFGGLALRSFPTQAVDFLVQNNIQGNFFNDFNSGAYLLGRTYPNIKVFIDGRTEAYGGQFFKKYYQIWHDGDGKLFEENVQKYHLTGAFLSSVRQHVPKKFLKYFYGNPDWAAVYCDYDAVVFLRHTPENEPIIQKFAIDFKNWQPLKIDIKKIGPIGPLPYQNYYRAYTLESLGLKDQALAEAREALKVVPWYGDVHELMGKIYGQRQEYRQAFKHFRIAAIQSPLDPEVRYNFALAYRDIKDYPDAIKQYEDIVNLWPDDPKGYYFLAYVYALSGDYESSIKITKEAYQKDSRARGDLMQIGDVFYNQKAYQEAKEVYELLLNNQGQDNAVRQKIQMTMNAIRNEKRGNN